MVAAVEAPSGPRPILADAPEVLALATLASVSATTMAAAFNDPEHIFSHMSLDELGRLQNAAARLTELNTRMARALAIYSDLITQQATVKASKKKSGNDK